MINLISPPHRKSLQTAKNNTILLGYVQVLTVAIIIIAGVVGASYYFLKVHNDTVRQAAAFDAAEAKKLESYQKQADKLASSLTSVKGVFERDVSFSSMLQQFGALMPPGSALTGLELSSETGDAPLTMTALIDTEARAVVLLKNLTSSSLVSSATLRTVQQAETDTDTVSSYRYTATYEVVLRKEAK